MNCKSFLLAAAAGLAAACRSEPRFVFVPAAEPEVELRVRASATEVYAGEPVVLHAERRHRGEWERVERASLAPGRCWLGSPPPDREAEVADNLRWGSIPAESAVFNLKYREDRTREVVFGRAGRYILQSSSAVWCRPKDAKGRPIEILVREKPRS